MIPPLARTLLLNERSPALKGAQVRGCAHGRALAAVGRPDIGQPRPIAVASLKSRRLIERRQRAGDERAHECSWVIYELESPSVSRAIVCLCLMCNEKRMQPPLAKTLQPLTLETASRVHFSHRQHTSLSLGWPTLASRLRQPRHSDSRCLLWLIFTSRSLFLGIRLSARERALSLIARALSLDLRSRERAEMGY